MLLKKLMWILLAESDSGAVLIQVYVISGHASFPLIPWETCYLAVSSLVEEVEHFASIFHPKLSALAPAVLA